MPTWYYTDCDDCLSGVLKCESTIIVLIITGTLTSSMDNQANRGSDFAMSLSTIALRISTCDTKKKSQWCIKARFDRGIPQYIGIQFFLTS